MSTYGLPFDRIDGPLLESLRKNAVAEDRQLEYKQQLLGGDDKSKYGFLAEVSAFANGVGGDLIYGVEEARDAAGPLSIPKAIVGLPGVSNLGQEMLRLESMLLTGIDPRIPGVRFHP